MLKHELLGEFEQTITIPAKEESQTIATVDTSKYTITEERITNDKKFEGKFVPKEEPKKLEVAGLKMTPTGALTIRFSKTIKKPNIRLDVPKVTNST